MTSIGMSGKLRKLETSAVLEISKYGCQKVNSILLYKRLMVTWVTWDSLLSVLFSLDSSRFGPILNAFCTINHSQYNFLFLCLCHRSFEVISRLWHFFFCFWFLEWCTSRSRCAIFWIFQALIFKVLEHRWKAYYTFTSFTV